MCAIVSVITYRLRSCLFSKTICLQIIESKHSVQSIRCLEAKVRIISDFDFFLDFYGLSASSVSFLPLVGEELLSSGAAVERLNK